MSLIASMPVTTSFPDGIMINAHCLDVLKKIKNKSVSAIIIDPPYGAQTHNQNIWDIAWSSELWQDIVKECFRVLVKGGHMVVFSSGKTFRKIDNKIFDAYETLFGEEPSNYPMVWEHSSLDSGRVHSHTPRSQCEFLSVFYRTGEGKEMVNQGTLKKFYALDQHIGRTNVLKYYKDDCRSKPQPTVKKFFEDNPNNWTFDYKPEALMRALIRDFTSPGHTVVDFCTRHGMTAVAAKLESRKFIGVELEKKAYERAVSRYSELFSTDPSRIVVPVDSPVTKSASMGLIERQEDEEAIGRSLSPSSSTSTLATTDIESDTESGVMLTRKTRRNIDSVFEEGSPKRQAVSLEGKMIEIGTPKRFTKLIVFKKIVSIDGDQYLVAYPDKMNELKLMTIWKKEVQRHIGNISASDMTSLGKATMPYRF